MAETKSAPAASATTDPSEPFWKYIAIGMVAGVAAFALTVGSVPVALAWGVASIVATGTFTILAVQWVAKQTVRNFFQR